MLIAAIMGAMGGAPPGVINTSIPNIAGAVPQWLSLNADGTYDTGSASGNWVTGGPPELWWVFVEVTSGSFQSSSPVGEWIRMSELRLYGRTSPGSVTFNLHWGIPGRTLASQNGITLTAV